MEKSTDYMQMPISIILETATAPQAVSDPLIVGPADTAQASSTYPLDALPQGIRAAVEEVHGFVQAPIEMVASSALAALSVAAQGLVDVQRDQGLSGPSSLFFVTVASSGERKSTLDKHFTSAIRNYEAEQKTRHHDARHALSADTLIWSNKRKKLLAQLEEDEGLSEQQAEELRQDLISLEKTDPKAARIPRLIYSDATSEKVLQSLAQNWPSGAILSSEGGTVLGGHAMNRDSITRTLAAYNTLWDGGYMEVDRKTGDSFTLSGKRFTFAIQVQPGVLDNFLSSNGGIARDIGFTSRMLMLRPETTQGTRVYRDAPEWLARDAFNNRLSVLLNMPLSMTPEGVLNPQLLVFSAEARRDWIDLYNAIEAEMGPSGAYKSIPEVASKAAENIARLAALLHLYEDSEGFEIQSRHIQNAGKIVEWHLEQAWEILRNEKDVPTTQERLRRYLQYYFSKTGDDEISIRKLRRIGPKSLRTGTDLTTAIQCLIDEGFVSLENNVLKKT